MSDHLEQIQFLGKHQFNYKQLHTTVGVNENTLRTWMRKYLTNVGIKKESGRMLYSGVDCIYTRIFSELTTTLSIYPLTSKFICDVVLERIKELLLVKEEDILDEQKSPKFLVINEMYDGKSLEYQIMTRQGISKMCTVEYKLPFIVVPIDSIFWLMRGRVFEMSKETK